MRCVGSGGVLLLLLISLSALSASTAEANKESSSENAGRKWHLRGRRAMSARGLGDARKDEAVGAKNTGANQEADHASAEVVHDETKGSATHSMFQLGASDRPSHDDAATVAADMLKVDYSIVDVHSRRPINNDAPLDELAEKKP
ncbi:unnamed protein product [Alopecurus aequalis]